MSEVKKNGDYTLFLVLAWHHASQINNAKHLNLKSNLFTTSYNKPNKYKLGEYKWFPQGIKTLKWPDMLAVINFVLVAFLYLWNYDIPIIIYRH